jgi:division protein CdvB (Snf7/Vps24/ESCRT-III family)
MSYSRLETLRDQLETISKEIETTNKEEYSKGLMDSFLKTGDLDDLEEVDDLLKEVINLLDTITGDPTP